MWKGASAVHHEAIKNVAFVRTRIEFIERFFDRHEVDEIWLTFPDPQLKRRRHKKRLTGARFLNAYQTFLKPDGSVHLKTDSHELYHDLLGLLAFNGIEPAVATDHLYGRGPVDEPSALKTFYEQQFLEEGKKITYIHFKLPGGITIKECSNA
jgi:tRNA (guanine-N7-)-methyltransferase